MKKEDPPICPSCGTLLSVKYIVSECHYFETDKRDAGVSNIMSETLHPDNISHMIPFLIKTNLINNL